MNPIQKLINILTHNGEGFSSKKRLCFVLDQSGACGKLSCDACAFKDLDEFNELISQLEKLKTI